MVLAVTLLVLRPR